MHWFGKSGWDNFGQTDIRIHTGHLCDKPILPAFLRKLTIKSVMNKWLQNDWILVN